MGFSGHPDHPRCHARRTARTRCPHSAAPTWLVEHGARYLLVAQAKRDTSDVPCSGTTTKKAELGKRPFTQATSGTPANPDTQPAARPIPIDAARRASGVRPVSRPGDALQVQACRRK